MKLRIESDGTRNTTTVVDESGAQRLINGLSLEKLEPNEVGIFIDGTSRDSLEDIDEIELHFKGPVFIRTAQRNAATWPVIELDPELMKRNQVA